MGLEVRFKVLKGCICEGFQRYRGFTVCVSTESSGFRVTSIIRSVDGHASVSVRRSSGAQALRMSQSCWKMFWHRSGKDTEVGLGCVSGLPPVEQDSANELGNSVPLMVTGRSGVARATRRWPKCGYHLVVMDDTTVSVLSKPQSIGGSHKSSWRCISK